MSELAVTSRVTHRRLPSVVIMGVLAAAAAGWLILTERMAGTDSGPGGDPAPCT